MKASWFVMGFVALTLAGCGGDDAGNPAAGGSAASSGTGGASGSSATGGSAGSSGQPSQCDYPATTTLGTVETTTLVSVDDPENPIDSASWSHFALDATHVYWAADDNDPIEVHRLSRQGGAQELVTTFEKTTFFDLVLDGGFVYINTGSELLRAPVTGGESKVLSEYSLGSLATETMAIDATHVYLASSNAFCGIPVGVYSFAKADIDVTDDGYDALGSIKQLAEFSCPTALAVDDRYLYVSADGNESVEKTDTDGSTYTIAGFSPGAKLYRLSKSGGMPELLADVPYGAESLQVTSTHVYAVLTEYDYLYSSIIRVPIGGGTFEYVGNPGCADTDHVRISGDSVYHLNGSALVRLGLDGAAPRIFSTSDESVSSILGLHQIEVDGGVVYELNPEGAIYRHTLN